MKALICESMADGYCDKTATWMTSKDGFQAPLCEEHKKWFIERRLIDETDCTPIEAILSLAKGITLEVLTECTCDWDKPVTMQITMITDNAPQGITTVKVKLQCPRCKGWTNMYSPLMDIQREH